MTAEELRAGRVQAGMTQEEAAARLKVSQPYLSQLEKGQRSVSAALSKRAAAVYRLPPTALPLPEVPDEEDQVVDPELFARQLSGLGYPGFAHLRPSKTNPAALVLTGTLQQNLETRLTEALPWVLLHYAHLNWPWRDAQNRLGFLVARARRLCELTPGRNEAAKPLAAVEQQLQSSRLAREDTLCRASMPPAERRWLQQNRSALARHWNLLTGLSVEQRLAGSPGAPSYRRLTRASQVLSSCTACAAQPVAMGAQVSQRGEREGVGRDVRLTHRNTAPIHGSALCRVFDHGGA